MNPEVHFSIENYFFFYNVGTWIHIGHPLYITLKNELMN